MSFVTPTFADGPSTFLAGIFDKSPNRPDSHGREIQKMRTDVSSQLREIQNKSDSTMRRLESQLMQVGQEMRPRLVGIERQLGFIQKQLEDARKRQQKIENEDLTPLQNQYDQIGLRFNRLVRSEVEMKIKPIKEELRDTKMKLEEMIVATNGSCKKLNDKIRDIQEKIDKSNNELQSIYSKSAMQLEDLQPKIGTIENRFYQLRQMVNDMPTSSIGVVKQLTKVMRTINNIEQVILPQQIDDSSASFQDAVKDLGKYCEDQIAELHNDIKRMTEEKNKIEDKREDVDEFLDSLMKQSYDVQSKVNKLDQDARSKISALDHNVKDTLENLKLRVSDMQDEGLSKYNNVKSQAFGDIDNLKAQVNSTIIKMKNAIKDATSENKQKQQEALSKLAIIKNQISGDANALERIKKTEEQLFYCINKILKIKTTPLYSKMSNAHGEILLKKIEDIEKRLALVEERASKFDGNPVGKAPKLAPVIERIAPIPPECIEQEGVNEEEDEEEEEEEENQKINYENDKSNGKNGEKEEGEITDDNDKKDENIEDGELTDDSNEEEGEIRDYDDKEDGEIS